MKFIKDQVLTLDEPFSSKFDLNQKKERLKEIMGDAIDGFMDRMHA